MQTGIEPGGAVPADAPAMAALHVRAWRAAYTGIMPDAFLAGLRVEEREAMWRRSLTAPEVAPAERAIFVAEEAGTLLGLRGRRPRPRRRRIRARASSTPSTWIPRPGGGRRERRAAGRGDRRLDARFAASILWVVDRNPAREHSLRERRLVTRRGDEDRGLRRTSVSNCRYRHAAVRAARPV